jgi:hypothetical protein
MATHTAEQLREAAGIVAAAVQAAQSRAPAAALV